MAGNRRWSPQEDALLKQLYLEWTPLKEIAARLLRSYDAVTTRINLWRLKR